MAADDLTMEETRASAAMVLTYFSRNILVSAPEGLHHGSVSVVYVMKTITE